MGTDYSTGSGRVACCGLADRRSGGFGVGMLDPRTSRFWQSALQSGLMSAEELSACWDAIPPEKREAPDHLDRRLARQAVNRGTLTLWQARQLMAGRFTGYHVDRYVLLDLIGQGGMGRVYLARDSRLNRRVALKILSPERVNNPRAIARFQREARVGAQLQHENLIRIYDFGESQGRFFLVMEYIEGHTIGHYIATAGRIPPRVAASLGRQIALGLDHAHRKGLIHRDVNPYNVMITRDGVAKLADLGLAIDTADEARVTRDGATVGTFDYVAPEQARQSHLADIRSDIYSLGCTLYHMIAGRVPFAGPSLAEKLFAHQSQDATPLEQFAPEVPPALAEAVRVMMRKDPTERFATPRQVAEALAPFVDRRPGAAGAGIPATSASAETRAVAAQAAAPATPTTGPGAALRLGGSTPSDEFPIVVDLGPEPSLSDSFRVNRSWFGGSFKSPMSGSGSSTSSSSTSDPQRSGSAIEGPAPGLSSIDEPKRRSRRLVGGLSAALVVALIGLAALLWRRAEPSVQPPPPRANGRAAAGGSKATETHAPAPRPAPESPPAAISVLEPDGAWKPADHLAGAMEAALASRGTVVLQGPAPILVESGAKPAVFNGQGVLKLRSARGAPAPTLRINLDDQKPFLSTGPGMSLEIENLIIEASGSDADPKAKKPTEPPPIFLAAGEARFDRCAFRTAETSGFAGSRAIRFEGGNLSVDGCWFEGFDAAIEVRAFAGASSVVRRTMFVPGGTPTEAAKAGRPVRTGWGLQMRFHGGGPSTGKRTLQLEHCTFSGEGLIRLDGFSEHFPATLETFACAVRSEALLFWAPEPAGEPPNAASVRWTGRNNQLDVAGTNWIVGPSAESPPSPEIDDLDAWSELVVERESIRAAIQFPFEPQTDDGRLTPAAYAVKPTGKVSPGADPADVGPRL